VAGAAVFALLISMAAVSSLTAALPPAVGTACVVLMVAGGPPIRRAAGWITAVPGTVSWATTVVVLALDVQLSTRDGLFGIVEVAVLLVLLAGIVRWMRAPALWVCGILTATAQVAWIVRFLPDRDPGPLLAACALWSLPAMAAVIVGGYPRLAAARLRRSVSTARAEQRRALERDLHDYVAHDLSGMIVQAQAAQFADSDDPEFLRQALRRIERSGQRAMTSMDRALELLAQDDDQSEGTRHRPGLEELEQLVGNFREGEARDVQLRVQGTVAELPREVSETLYRACVEALTNVRRHAPDATEVAIDLLVDTRTARLRVSDNGRQPPLGRRPRGGSGLRNVRARVETLHGTFHAGARDPGWTVTATLPVPSRPQDGSP
jgi:signal transduction histidine kinase